MIHRIIKESIVSDYRRKKVIVLLGARQVGKWNGKAKAALPKNFALYYPNSTYEVITPENYWNFLK